jgi:valyl-tRNA synthetase
LRTHEVCAQFSGVFNPSTHCAAPATLALPLAGIIDVAAESKRLKREIDKVGSEIRQLDAKLANEKFVARAPEHVVEEQRERKADAEATAARLEQALKRLEAAL